MDKDINPGMSFPSSSTTESNTHVSPVQMVTPWHGKRGPAMPSVPARSVNHSVPAMPAIPACALPARPKAPAVPVPHISSKHESNNPIVSVLFVTMAQDGISELYQRIAMSLTPLEKIEFDSLTDSWEDDSGNPVSFFAGLHERLADMLEELISELGDEGYPYRSAVYAISKDGYNRTVDEADGDEEHEALTEPLDEFYYDWIAPESLYSHGNHIRQSMPRYAKIRKR